MNEQCCIVRFPGTDYTQISLDKHQNLSEYLTVQNSPILFGCRTGICGTCLVVVEGEIPPPNEDEQEMLEILVTSNIPARLACQLDLTSNIKITRFEEDK